MEKTIKEWLNELLDGYRERALRSIIFEEQNNNVPSMCYAIDDGLDWRHTPEGFTFWKLVYDHYGGEALPAPDLPPLPETEAVLLDEKNQSSSTLFPEDATERKTYPMYRGLLKYFPNALAAVAHQSYQGNQQHHPDKPLHWDMDKSTDEADAIVRHLMEGDYVAVAWRALSLLERVKTNNIKENTL